MMNSTAILSTPTRRCPRCGSERYTYEFQAGRSECKACSRKRDIERHDQRQAHHAIRSAVRSGKIPRPDAFSCVVLGCEKPARVYHHWMGHAKEHWFHVLPLCQEHNTRHCHEQIDFKM